MMRKLLSLRRRVRKIDRKIIKLIYQRLNLTEKIGREKRRLELPLHDWSVEKSVIKNSVNYAQRFGLNTDLVKFIITKLIEYARIRQEKIDYASYTGDREDILVIGGLGAMGCWFTHFFQNQGHRVSVCDIRGRGLKGIPYYRNLSIALKGKSCVLISTPLNVVPEMIDEISRLKYQGIVFDIASVKTYLIPAIKRASKNGLKFTSIHPMFGPSCHTLTDKIICLCSCGCSTADKKILSFFKDTAATLINLSFDEHDRLVSYVLGFSHFINILFIKTLIDSGYNYEDFKKVASTTFNLQFGTTISVIKENPELYFEIQSLNPHQKKLFNHLKEELNMLVSTINSGDKEVFQKIFQQGCDWINYDKD
ncbi:MAG: prephenate dehydrogenase/arogenate dehydrogenase family protein [bacterium]